MHLSGVGYQRLLTSLASMSSQFPVHKVCSSKNPFLTSFEQEHTNRITQLKKHFSNSITRNSSIVTDVLIYDVLLLRITIDR